MYVSHLYVAFKLFHNLLKIISNVTFCFHISVYSNKESTHLNFNITQVSDQNQVKVGQDGEQKRSDQCNKLQERFNVLTRDKNLLENRNSELTNMIKKVEEEKDRLKMKLRGEGKKPGCVLTSTLFPFHFCLFHYDIE